MLTSLTLILSIVNTLLVLITVCLAYVNIQKFRQSRGIDFILDAESAIDPVRHGLVGADPALIRNIFRDKFYLEELSDEDCKAFPFMHAVYAHVSRMYFILYGDRLDYGLDAHDKDETINSWIRYLVLFKDHPAMQAVHRQTLRDRDRNSAFIDIATKLLGDESSLSSPIAAHTETFASSSWLTAHHEATVEAREAFALSLRLGPDSVILDVACGAGGWSETFARLYPGCKVLGFDLSAEEFSLTKFTERHLRKQVRFVAADVDALPFKSKSFDLVYLANSLQYGDLEDAVPRLYSLLRTGGRLIIRNFDEGYTLLFPCRPELQAKVIWAAARTTENADCRIDPYVGRRLKNILRHDFSEEVTFNVIATKLEWPFTRAQRTYIQGNIRYLASMARQYITENEYQEWIALAEDGSEGNLFDDKSAYYMVYEFCAQLSRSNDSSL